MKTRIEVEVNIDAPLDIVWKKWTTPLEIVKWYNAGDDWHTPSAENDLQEGGNFKYRMEAKDKSAGFDFQGTYTKIITYDKLEYILDDNRLVTVNFSTRDKSTKVSEIFEAEDTIPKEMQREGWQSILDNFKKYVESHSTETK